MSCKTRRVTLNPSPYPDNTMSRRYCQPHMGAVYDQGEEPQLRIWDPSNPVTHPNCMCTYVPIGPPEFIDGPTEIDTAGTYEYHFKCGPTPYNVSVDTDYAIIDDVSPRPEVEWAHPKVPEWTITIIIDPCDEDFTFNITVADKDDDTAQYVVEVSCGCCQDEAYVAPSVDGDGEVTCPGSYMYLVEDGCPPYKWTIDPDDDDYKITESGVVQLSSQACGSFTVTVTDKCDNEASLDVRVINNGHWASQCYAAAIAYPGIFDYYPIINPHTGQPCNAHIGVITGASYDVITVYSGKYKFVVTRLNWYTNGAWKGEDCFLPESDKAYIEPLFLAEVMEYQGPRFYQPSQGNCPEGMLRYVLNESHVAYNGFDYFGFRFLVPEHVAQFVWDCS